ncbi:MAG: helix-turn-helix domain-containing protein [Microthrixaceae bacterium]
MLAVLVETTAELNLRTIAQLAGISQAQTSRLLPDLVDLGVVERREVPPSSLFRLVPEHIASRALLALANSHEAVLDEMGQLVRTLPHPPVSVIVFGSFARREADADSDIDVVAVRPVEIDEDDDTWITSLESWRRAVRQLSGNPVEILEVSTDEAARKLRGRSPGMDRHPTVTDRSSTASTSTPSREHALTNPRLLLRAPDRHDRRREARPPRARRSVARGHVGALRWLGQGTAQNGNVRKGGRCTDTSGRRPAVRAQRRGPTGGGPFYVADPATLGVTR